jgi:hypothetical protein
MDKELVQKLWNTRIKSFLLSLGSLLLTGLVGVLVSDDFKNLVQEYAGSSVTGTIVMLLLSEGIKHLRNKIVIGKAIKTFGSDDDIHTRVDIF